MSNLLNTPIDYQVTETGFGTWKRYLYQNGGCYQEFTSHASIGSLPFLHLVAGRNPETGRIGTAQGVIAIGQAAWGVIAVGQLAIGLMLGVGQAAVGIVAIGQAAAGVFTVGQFALGAWTLAQYGVGHPLRPWLKF